MTILQLSNAELSELILTTVRQALSESVVSQKQQTTTDTPQYLGVKETAKFLNLAPQTIYQLVCAGKLKNYKRNKRLYFLQSDLQNFIQQGERKTLVELAIESQNYLKTKKA